MKYIKLVFKDAKLFLNHKGTRSKQIIFNQDGTNKSTTINRREQGNFEEYITIHQISNVLHSLFGERPVPSFRKVIYDRNESLFEKAGESYLKIDYFTRETKAGKEVPVKEFIQLDKANYNALLSNYIITWEVVKKRMNYDKGILKVVKKAFKAILGRNISEGVPYMEYVEEIRQTENYAPLDVLRPLKATYIINQIVSDFNGQVGFSTVLGVITPVIINGVDEFINLKGEILVPVSSEDIQRLKKFSSGVCTILDGGQVGIDGSILYEDEFMADTLDGFRKVKNISTNKVFV